MKRQLSNKKYRILTIVSLVLGCATTFYVLLFRLGFLMSPQQLTSFFCVSCQPEKSFHPTVPNENLLNDEQSLENLINQNNFTVENISILIEKSKYKLTIFYNLKAIKSYPVVFGGNPQGDKLHQGDQKTPEGIYYIRDLYPHDSWSKFIWLDYPRTESWREHFQAKLTGNLNWLLPIGGEIGIHGVSNGSDYLIENLSNWTLGCISLKNNDVDEIYNFVHSGTLVEIIP